MFRLMYGTNYRLAAAMLCGSALFAQTSGMCEEGSPSIDEELKTMSKVLEASLDSSGIEDWHASFVGYSAFESKIRGEYIPTVGAIFTINVNFPIVKPEEEVTEADEEAEDSDDLWEQMSKRRTVDWRSKNTWEEITGIGVSLLKDHDGETVVVNTYIDSPAANAGIEQYDVIVEVEGNLTRTMDLSKVADLIGGPEGSMVVLRIRSTDESDDAATEVKLERAKIKTNSNRTFHFDSRDWGEDPVSFRLLGNQDRTVIFQEGRGDQYHGIQLLQAPLKLTVSGFLFHENEYDAKKVDSLRNTLIATVARYGHRMTQVGDSERILLIVNAPHGGGNELAYWGERANALWSLAGTSRQDRDRILFSFGKADLEEGTSLEILEEKVEVVTY